MPTITIAPVRRADAPELIQANLDNRAYHAPWSQPFTDMEGFEGWFGQLVTGPNFSVIAREQDSGAVVGVLKSDSDCLGRLQERVSWILWHGRVLAARSDDGGGPTHGALRL